MYKQTLDAEKYEQTMQKLKNIFFGDNWQTIYTA